MLIRVGDLKNSLSAINLQIEIPENFLSLSGYHECAAHHGNAVEEPWLMIYGLHLRI